jgi:hypothetical protein
VVAETVAETLVDVGYPVRGSDQLSAISNQQEEG